MSSYLTPRRLESIEMCVCIQRRANQIRTKIWAPGNISSQQLDSDQSASYGSTTRSNTRFDVMGGKAIWMEVEAKLNWRMGIRCGEAEVTATEQEILSSLSGSVFLASEQWPKKRSIIHKSQTEIKGLLARNESCECDQSSIARGLRRDEAERVASTVKTKIDQINDQNAIEINSKATRWWARRERR